MSSSSAERSTSDDGVDRETNATRLGLSAGMVVQEVGWDSDVDDELRVEIEDLIDAGLVEEAVDSADVVLLWWRDDDGDLVDGLVDAIPDLAGNGVIWVLTPKVGRPGYLDASDLSEAAITAGLSLTTSAQVSADWAAHKIVRPKSRR